MPEGDSVHRAARRLQAVLAGKTLTAVEGSHPAVGEAARRLVGDRVRTVEAIGKHLVLTTEGGWALRTHLGMTGRWRTYEPGQRWSTTPGKARLVLRSRSAVAVCFAAPTVEISRASVVRTGLESLGPDLVVADPPVDVIVDRSRVAGAATVADLLLDQTVASGIGNVFKSEILFLERIDPSTPPEALADSDVARLYRRGHRLLSANAGLLRDRTTTGAHREAYWVYGRGGRPCRRCGTPIVSDVHGTHDRVTYRCPSCQSSTTIDRSFSKG